MRNIIITLFLLLSILRPLYAQVGIGTNAPQATLDVNGAVKIGSDATAPSGGTVRWNEAAKDLEVHNGIGWISLSRINAGTPAEGDLLEYRNGQWVTKPKTRRYYVSGVGLNPPSSLNFIGPTATVTIEKDNPVITIHITKTVGAYVDNGLGLTVNLGYRKSGQAITAFQPDDAIENLRVPKGTRFPLALSGTFSTSFQAGETYEIGIIGSTTNFSTWSDNHKGMGYVEISY